MSRRCSRREIVQCSALAASTGLAGCLDAVTGRRPSDRLRQHEDSLDRFTDVEVAIDEGYRTSATYVRTDDGCVGVPFVNPEVDELQPEQPQAVLYQLTERGRYEPLGLKWFVPTEESDGPPSLFGREFSGPHERESPLVPEHYALHAWLFRENSEGLFAFANGAVEPPGFLADVESVRAKLEEFPVGQAVEERGYTNTEQCVGTDEGGYGVPFVREAAVAEGGTDPENPPILVFGLTRSWTYELLGAEWYVPASAVDEPPTLFGQPFHEPMDGHSPETDQPEHYGLHAWLFRANPEGLFAPMNPTVSC